MYDICTSVLDIGRVGNIPLVFFFTLYSAELQTLASAMQPSREEIEWGLSQMDREVGISFSSDFNFSLAALLYKGGYIFKNDINNYSYFYVVCVYVVRGD